MSFSTCRVFAGSIDDIYGEEKKEATIGIFQNDIPISQGGRSQER